MKSKSILIVGLFNKKNSNAAYLTAAEQLALLLQEKHIPVITTSYSKPKILRLAETVSVIIHSSKSFDIGIVPLYGTMPSVIWQEIASRLLKLLNKKIVLIVHGGSIPERMQTNATLFLKAFRRANVIIAPSPFFKTFLKRYSVEAKVIENVLDLSRYSFHSKKEIRPAIIWMRSFEDVYNPEMAVRVAAILKRKYPGFKMLMAGSDHGALNAIKEMINRFELKEQILLPGFISHQQKLQYAKEYDIYICTNRIDNAPVSLIEFMALGLPIVSVNAGGIPYIIKDGENGLLVNIDDDEAMVNKIELLIQQPALAQQIAENAFHYSRRYDKEPVFEKWLQVFNQLRENKTAAGVDE